MLSDSNIYTIDSYPSDGIRFVSDNIFNNSFLDIRASGQLTSIKTVSCTGVCSKKPISDCACVRRLQNNAVQIINFLNTHFPSDYCISDPCRLTYTGPLTAHRLMVDLIGGSVIFKDFSLSCP